jgi:plasmid stabilization system protein ParE
VDYEVIFTPEANRHLAKLYEFIEGESSPETAQRFTNSIVDIAMDFRSFRIAEHNATTSVMGCVL